MTAINDLIQWAEANGCLISPNITFSNLGDGYYGALYKETGKTVEGLADKHIRLPTSLIMTLQHAIQSFNQQGLGDFKDIVKQTTNTNALLKLYLARERTSQYLTESKFKHYITLLPNLHEINSPYSWTAEEKAYLKGTNLGNSLKDNLSMLVEEWWQLINLLPQDLAKPSDHFVNMKFYYEYKFHNDNDLYQYFNKSDIDNWTSFPNYLWGALILKSRSFPAYLIKSPDNTDVKLDEAMLLPVIDLMNHDMTAQVEWSVNNVKSEQYFDFKSDCAADNQELFNNYGRKGNEELLLAYGFCIDGNEADSAAVKIKIPLEMLPDLQQKGIKLPKPEDYTHSVIRTPSTETSDTTTDDLNQYSDGLLFFITREILPDNLILLFQWLSRNNWEDKLSIRMKFAGLNNLRLALEQKLDIIKQITLPTGQSTNERNIKIYITAQREIFSKAIKGIKHIEKQMLVDPEIKPNLLSLKSIFKKDKKFADSLLISLGITSFDQLVENNFQDQAWLLYLIRCHNRKEYDQDDDDVYIPEWIYQSFEKLSKEYKISAQEILQFKELYEGLIIPLTQTAPDVFDRGDWTVDELIYSARLLDTISFLRGKEKECILVKP